ncbi:MAG: ABC transporter permease [Clostridium sp.]|jgi:peptide/nickel transport system permease protein|nr:ABC transporter permease [Clostridium sp.]
MKKNTIQERNTQKAQERAVSLDSLERVRILSPGRLVFHRFLRNRLAIVGSVVLAAMFLFSFLCPLFYPYSQTRIFYKYDRLLADYAVASIRTDYAVTLSDPSKGLSVRNQLNSYISQMESSGETRLSVEDQNGRRYELRKEAAAIYSLYEQVRSPIGTVGGFSPFAAYNSFAEDLRYTTGETAGEGFRERLKEAVAAAEEDFVYGGAAYRLVPGRKGAYTVERGAEGFTYAKDAAPDSALEAVILRNLDQEEFVYGGKRYTVTEEDGSFAVYENADSVLAAVMSTYVLDAYEDAGLFTDSFRINALLAVGGAGSFTDGGVSYSVVYGEDGIFLCREQDREHPVALLSEVAVRAYSGEDSLDLAFKEKAREVIADMEAAGTYKSSFEWEIPQLNSEGKYTYDENGDLAKEPTTVYVENKNFTYNMTCTRVSYLIDIFAEPSKAHWFGTDGDGMDILARMMYGGRVSLLVCFVVIILETILGVILGGIAGFFGGWIDNLIMRLVDVFYCIPSLPILIIIAALFDALKMEPYRRLVWLMVILGILGWAGVARLVRGQILSLREQEFMLAAESIGLNTRRRIFKHLIPNVMPQLIVTASNGLGGIIIIEATLSFLGLGVKHPLATWGTMINSVTSSSESMIRYTYIWIPVGILICLTVVAFNFVGDGLRDAFDPKMKR